MRLAPCPPGLLGVALALAGAGCATTRPGPIDAVASYTAALRDGRTSDAYRLLSSEAQRALSQEDFERLAREHPDEVQETLRWLDQADPSAPVTARLDLPSGETLTLSFEGGRWRLDPAALDFYGQHTPRQTLRSFVRALRRQRYDVLVRFAPRRLARGLTAEALRRAWGEGPQQSEVEEMVAALAAALDRPIEVIGDRATMSYGRGGRFLAQLVREDGVWKIDDPG